MYDKTDKQASMFIALALFSDILDACVIVLSFVFRFFSCFSVVFFCCRAAERNDAFIVVLSIYIPSFGLFFRCRGLEAACFFSSACCGAKRNERHTCTQVPGLVLSFNPFLCFSFFVVVWRRLVLKEIDESIGSCGQTKRHITKRHIYIGFVSIPLFSLFCRGTIGGLFFNRLVRPNQTAHLCKIVLMYILLVVISCCRVP